MQSETVMRNFPHDPDHPGRKCRGLGNLTTYFSHSLLTFSRPLSPPLSPSSSLLERLSQLSEIERKGEEKKEVLSAELERTEKLLTATYDK